MRKLFQPSSAFNEPHRFFCICILAPLLGGVVSVWLGADINWDLTNYHFYNPFALFHNKLAIDLAPAGMQTYFNPLLDIPYYWMVNHLPAVCAGFVMGAVHAINFVLVALIARVLLSELSIEHQYKWAIGLALFGCLTANFSAAFGNTMGDVTTAVLILLALWIMVRVIATDGQQIKHLLRSALLAGFFVGIAAGLKLTNSVYALSLCLSFFVLPFAWRMRICLVFLFGIAALIGLSLTAGYWFYDMWVQFGNPLFPQFSSFFPNELTSSLGVLDIAWRPKNISENLLWPFILSFNPSRVGELKHHQIIWAVFYLAVIFWSLKLAIITIRKKQAASLTAAQKYIIAFVLLAFLIWMKLFSIQRYLAAVEILLPLMLFILLHQLLPHERATKFAKFLLMITTATVYIGGAKTWGHADWAVDMFRIDLPVLNSPEKTTVIMSGGNPPLGWVAAQFPANIAFAQIEGSFPANIPAYNQRIHQMIDARGGETFALFQGEIELSPLQYIAKANTYFAWINLTTTMKGCKFLNSLIPKLNLQEKFRLDFIAENQCQVIKLYLLKSNAKETSAIYAATAKKQLADYGFVLDVDNCHTYRAYIGQKVYPYQWCPISKQP